MKKVFLTGGTGFVGSNIAYQLLKLGCYKVIFLVRQAAGIASEARLEAALKVIDPDFNFANYDYQIINGDICLPNLGISTDDLNSLKADKPDSIFHCAGSISFSERESDATWKINVEGTRNVIAFACNVGIRRLNHVSTAYVAGASEGLCKERVGQYPDAHFNNPYEKTKFYAELEVAESKLSYSIYRPSIIIGNTQEGSALSFGGYYGYLSPFWKLKEKLCKAMSNSSKIYLDAGIKLVDNELILPIAIECFWEATLNLIPVDWFSKTAIELSEKDLSVGQVFNVTHPTPLPIKDVIINSLNILGIKGMQFINPDFKQKFENKVLQNIQRMVNGGIGDYTPYTTQKHRFADFNMRAVLNSSYQPPPPIDNAFLERTLNYAIAHNFKR